ncbi:Uncharacterized protein OBRU01_03874, partial [Operophtera brumata]
EKPGYRRIHDADLAYISLKTPERLTSPLKTPVKKLNLKLVKSSLKPIVKYFHSQGGAETSTKKAIETPPEKGTSFKNVQIEQISYDNVETEKTTTEYVEINNSTLNKTEVYEHFKTINQNNLGGQNHLNESFIFALDQFENQLYAINFNKFTALTPAANRDSGMSFIQSGLFLEMALMALSTEVDVGMRIIILFKGQNKMYKASNKLASQLVRGFHVPLVVSAGAALRKAAQRGVQGRTGGRAADED